MKTARLSWRVRDNVVARATCGDWFDGDPATTLQQRIDEEMEEAGSPFADSLEQARYSLCVLVLPTPLG